MKLTRPDGTRVRNERLNSLFIQEETFKRSESASFLTNSAMSASSVMQILFFWLMEYPVKDSYGKDGINDDIQQCHFHKR